MNRRSVSIIIYILLFGLPATTFAKDRSGKPGPLTGTWECVGHGGSQGDLNFTLTLVQDKDGVTGSVSSTRGSAELTTATYTDKVLEIHIENDQAEYVIKGKLKGGKLSGDWTHGDEKGAWEGAKQVEPPPK